MFLFTPGNHVRCDSFPYTPLDVNHFGMGTVYNPIIQNRLDPGFFPDMLVPLAQMLRRLGKEFLQHAILPEIHIIAT